MSSSTYIFQANKVLPILFECQQKLQQTIEVLPRKRACSVLIDMQTTLCRTEQLIRDQILQLLEHEEIEIDEDPNSFDIRSLSAMTTIEIAQMLQEAYNTRRVQQQYLQHHARTYQSGHHNPQDPIHHRDHRHRHSKINDDQRHRFASSLLFNLSVQLQILLVRICDVDRILGCHGRPNERNDCDNCECVDDNANSRVHWSFAVLLMSVITTTIGSVGFNWRQGDSIISVRSFGINTSLSQIVTTAKEHPSIIIGGVAAASAMGVARLLRDWVVLRKIEDSNYNKIRPWIDQWLHCHSSSSSNQNHATAQVSKKKNHFFARSSMEQTINEKRARSTFWWMSQGEIRWSIIQRFMHVYYASVGTAISTKQSSPLSTLLMTGAASCFYSIIGASKQSMDVLNDSLIAVEMLKKAWGLPSLKQAKQASLFFNRFVKGASVSDKITIANVPCFILSKHPVPELAELRNQPTQRSQNLSQMSTIAEEEEIASHSGFEFSKTFGKRDVILHLTGGGFFAHTIASDLPYLLDWSETTNSVVIAPEYALLPETFPTALNQIIDIYQALVGGPDKESALPFEIDKICVTGESAGGNLAAALCVHLIQENHKNLTRTNPIPDCMMLSCPALDLSTESSPSRIRGREDPVLPNGLLTVIRDSYTGHHDKNDPLCSPIQASDEVLCDWCPLLMFVGSDDPLLDDAVAFNDRLQQCGVESEIRAATNVPHAYLGLATAGFPEAVEQHEYAMRWLRDIFSKTEHR